MEAGREYTCDLDGDGKKETIQWKQTGNTAVINVNGTKQAEANIQCIGFEVYLCDFKIGDKKKEICVEATGDSFTTADSTAYRYSNGKLKKYYSMDWVKYVDDGGGMQHRLFGSESISYNLNIQPGNGKVRFVCGGWDDNLGSFICYCDYKAADGSLKPANKRIYNITREWKKMPYYADEKLTVKAGRSNGKTMFTLTKGDTFYVDKLYARKERYNNFRVLYIYIRNAAGKKGWLKVPEHTFYHGEYGEKYAMS